MANIQPILSGTKVALEQQAVSQFGAAVETFSKGTLSQALGLPAAGTVPVNRNDGSFYATSYAAALAGANSYRPKLKFLFKVEFVFSADAIAQFPDSCGGPKANDFTFMIKAVDRPKIDFEYEDDVNMYNFRTKVLKRIRHRELTMTFMDDTGNRVLKFFRALMMLMSPITRRQLLREGSNRAPDVTTTGNGMVFGTTASDPSKPDTAYRGVFSNQNGGAGNNYITTIRVKQIFLDGSAQLASSVKEVIFDFMNPRLVSFDLDDLNHETSEVNLMTMQFDYDWMEIVDVGAIQKMDGPSYSISTPGVSGAPIDMTPTGGSASTNAGSGNPFLNIINNQIGRAASAVTSSAINRAVQSVAGNGAFATALGSQASNIVSGLVGAAGRDMASGIGISIANARAARTDGIIGAPNVVSSIASRATATSSIDTALGGPGNVVNVTRSNDSDPLGGFISGLGGT